MHGSIDPSQNLAVLVVPFFFLGSEKFQGERERMMGLSQYFIPVSVCCSHID